MWTYTAYILGKYCKKKSVEQLQFKEISDFVFNVIWKEEKMTLWDGSEELYNDLKYLNQLKIINLAEKKDINHTTISILNKKTLERAVKTVENSPMVTGVGLFAEYNKRINSALDRVFEQKAS